MSSIKVDIIDDFENIINQNSYVLPNDLLVIGISGGADSVAMLDIFSRLNRKANSFHLFAAHFDHQLRLGSKTEADFVQNLCDKINVRLFRKSQNVRREAKLKNRSEHDMARELRYAFLVKTAQKLKSELSFKKPPLIATAHHLDDQIETVIMRMVSGSGLSGLSGIRPRLNWKNNNELYVIRPLLSYRHNQLVNYCQYRGLDFLDDPTNTDTNYPRNYIRHQIIPVIEKKFGDTGLNGIVRSAEIIRGAEEFSIVEVDKMIAESVINRRSCELELDYRQYSSYLGWLRLLSIKRIVSCITSKTHRITYERCKAVERFLRHNQGGTLEIGGGVSATRKKNRIFIFRKPNAVKTRHIAVPGKYVLDDWGVLHLSVADIEKIDFPPPQNTLYVDWAISEDIRLELAPVSSGDRIPLLGMKGRRKVSDYLSDLGVPVYRRRYPAIWKDEEIVAIPPFGISELFKISDSSLQALMIIWEDA